MRISDWSSDVCSSDLGAMSRDLTAIWNAGMRVLVVAVVVMLVAGFRRAFEAERTRGNVDALTGAYSRQALNARIAATVALARRHKLTLRSEEHTSELQSLMRISSAVFCLKKQN